jgi:hypothetical protein
MSGFVSNQSWCIVSVFAARYVSTRRVRRKHVRPRAPCKWGLPDTVCVQRGLTLRGVTVFCSSLDMFLR